MILRGRNSLSVDKEVFECDYYDFCAGVSTAVNGYCGEYMTNYSWAEMTAGILTDKQNKT